MKKYNKAIAMILIFSMICLPLIGCGKTNNNLSVEETKLPEFTYVAEYEKIQIEDNLGQVLFTEDGFYYVNSNYNEETGVSASEFCYYDIERKITSIVPIFMEENEYVVQTLISPKRELVLITQMSDYSVENSVDQFFINVYNTDTEESTRIEITDELKSEIDYLYIQYAHHLKGPQLFPTFLIHLL
jgi:hypothetical protein